MYRLYSIIDEVEEEVKTIDRSLLLCLINICSEDNVQPLTMERLQAYVFIAQKAGVPFSYRDWVWKDDEEMK